jgi:hypothetical protein
MIEYVDGVSCVPEVVHDFLILDEAFCATAGYDDPLVAAGMPERHRRNPDAVNAIKIMTLSNDCPECSDLALVDPWKVGFPRQDGLCDCGKGIGQQKRAKQKGSEGYSQAEIS